ncbi:ABC transporter substrate-binding protein [Nocardioides sp. AE5]|uniref:ABC transporter substrate-binding protein n=1 Tax=Nocardioides sp. AE5 TaxID=2962573 RepID=UPI0028815927|nr:ABC transporter substrate-binding protein [Nocardioides sp. AE5]MDT0201300.1 ABC transporter substrate-binding protein [Nocardioides sp. AE5]
MIRPNKKLRLGTAIAVGAVLALGASCGSDDPDENNASGNSTNQATEGESGGSGGDAPDCSAKQVPDVKGDGVLKFGTLLPQTGSLAFLGPPEFAAVNLAVKDINEAGGVLGNDVEVVHSDSGDAQNPIASQSVDSLIAADADVVIGAASSSVSLLVIDKITDAGMVQLSPANTSDQFSSYCDGGLYFRTAPPDVLQGRVLAEQVIADGNATVAILALQDAYGTGLADQVEKNVKASNGEVVKKIIYDPKAANYATEVSEVKGDDPEAIVLIGFDETKKIIPELVKQGIGPATKKIYLVDGNLSDFSKDFDAGTMGPNVKGSLPGVAATDELKQRLATVDSNLTDWSYAAESYDGAILIALAAIAAESDAGPDIAKELVNVSKGGTKCTSFAECKELLENGEDIDYDGYSGPVDFLETGDPGTAFIGIYQYKPDGTYEFVEAQQGQISEDDIG